ncbi:MAG: NfeD family protein [Acidobacteriota bacterium]
MSWSPPVLWTVAGLVLIALEALAPGLVIMFFGLGALITALACLVLDLSWAAQLVLFACASVLSLLTLRGTLRKVFQGRQRQDQEQVEAIDSLVGADAVVSEDIEAGGIGRVKLRGSFYSATSDEALPAGQRVRVVEHPAGDHSLLSVVKK